MTFLPRLPLLACSLAALFLAPNGALGREAKPVEAAQVDETARPALWKVSDEDTTIWLFGTIHILPRPVDWHRGPIGKAFDTSQTLVTEVPMDNQQAAQGAILSMSGREDGRNLRDTLSAKDRSEYEAAMRGFGLPVAAFDGNDAWFAALMLTMLPLQLGGYDLENGIDRQVGDLAQTRGMTREALETPEYQISLFESLPEDVQQRYLTEVVDALPTMKDDIGRMVEAWRTGKAEELAKMLNEQEDDPAIRKVLLTNRNANWAKWIEERMGKPGSVFIAVGAGHLAGSDSVQAILAQHGLKAERVQ